MPSQDRIDRAVEENGGTLPKLLGERISKIMSDYNKDKTPANRIKRQFQLGEPSIPDMDTVTRNRAPRRRNFNGYQVPETNKADASSPAMPCKIPSSRRFASSKPLESLPQLDLAPEIDEITPGWLKMRTLAVESHETDPDCSSDDNTHESIRSSVFHPRGTNISEKSRSSRSEQRQLSRFKSQKSVRCHNQ